MSVASVSPALTDVLTALGDRVAPVSMALERTLPTSPECAELFTEGALVRGRVLSCIGSASTTVALRLVAAAVDAGGWLAVVDVPMLGLDAVSELGVPLERVVSISTEGDAEVWADVVAAAADGFEVLIARVPAGVGQSMARKVVTRLQQRGVVLVVLGDPGVLVCDGVVDSGGQVWSGAGAGWGRFERRSVEVTATGRRLPGRRCRTFEYPVASEAVSPEAVSPEAVAPEAVAPEAVAQEVVAVTGGVAVLELQNVG